MKKMVLWIFGFLVVILVGARIEGAEEGKEFTPKEPMTNARLDGILRSVETNIKGGNGRWEIVRDGVPLMVITDESHNRMRVIAPATEVKGLDPKVLMRMMEANFSTALDARYAVFKGIIWAAFLHPLDSLRKRDLISGLQQVVTLVKTTGTSYSSSGLHFNAPKQEEGK